MFVSEIYVLQSHSSVCQFPQLRETIWMYGAGKLGNPTTEALAASFPLREGVKKLYFLGLSPKPVTSLPHTHTHTAKLGLRVSLFGLGLWTPRRKS